MKRSVALMLVVTVFAGVLLSPCAFARGASDTAMEKASDKAVFHRVSDWFATRGKSPEEAKAIVAGRDAKRAAKRAEKEAARQKKIAAKEAEKAKKAAEKKMKAAKKGWGKK